MSENSSELPSLHSDYPLADEQIQSFRKEGFILLREVASTAEVAAYRGVIKSAANSYNAETRPLEERDTYGKAFLQIMNLWPRDKAVRQFVTARRFSRIAADLLGVEGVRVYHDQALFKEAGGGATPWHQDQHYWPLDTDKTVTLWMPLVNVDEQMGTMRFASGSHRVGYLGDLPISDESESIIQRFVEEKGYPIRQMGAMAAGDATFHTGWTLHGAPGNQSGQTREVMTVIYFADGARVTAADNANRRADLEWWLPGLRAGDLAASRLNPLVYHRE